MLRSTTLAALAVTLTAATTTAVYAASQDENDALAVDKAGISLTQAVTVAEQKVHGKASKAEYEQTKNGPAYDVEVVNGKQVVDVQVDAKDGSVLASTPDKVDHDDEQDAID